MNIKKSLLAIGAFAMSATAFSQGAFDALTLNQQDPILGTARYSSMAGAFGALGGNVSTMKDNPAGLGIYKRFDISFTPNLYLDNDNDVNFCLNNFGIVVNFRNREREKGYITSSLGISYNRLRNYSRYSSIKRLDCSGSAVDYMGYAETPDAVYKSADFFGLIDSEFNPTFSPYDNIDKTAKFKESGRAGEWDFSYGLNLSNRVYLGASMGVASFSYSQKALYDEVSRNSRGDYFYLDNFYDAEGVGVNFKVGAIVKATDFLRIGLAVHTPTFYNVDESYSIEMDYNDIDPQGSQIDAASYTYQLNTPFKLQASLGFVIGKRAIIGLQYGLDNYKAMRIKSAGGMKNEVECETIKEMFNPVHSIRAGLEIKVIDQLALRAGYAFISSPIDYDEQFGSYKEDFLFRSLSLPHATNYVTCGLGYEGNHFYCDFAYMFRNQATHFYDMLPKSEPSIGMNLKNHNISASFGWRF